MTTTAEWRKWNSLQTKPVTNYDRIISKTPEELADYCVAGSYCPPGVSCAGKATCNACWLDWLKEEAISDG